MQIYTYLWKNKIISDFSIDKYIRRRDSGVRIQQSAVSGQLSAFSCQLLWLNVVRDSGLGISNQDSAVSDQLSAVSKSLISTSTYLRISFPGVLRSPQLFLGHLSGEGFVKREVSEATSSLLETETTTGQRISADKENAGNMDEIQPPHRHIFQSLHPHIVTSVHQFLINFFHFLRQYSHP